MTAPDLKCECGTVLADGGYVGLYCPNQECRIEQEIAARAYKAMRDRKRLPAAPAPDAAAIREAALREAAGMFDADSNIAQTILALIENKEQS